MKSPAFQFYASDYLSSSKVQRMTLEEEGAYIRLLCYNWQDGSIPDDIPKLSRLCKTNPKRMAQMWEVLQECFGPMPDIPGRLFNPRLEHERQKQAEFRSTRALSGRNGGLKSGEARRKQDGSKNEAVLHSASENDEARLKQNEPLQSPSSSSEEEIHIAKSTSRSVSYSADFETFWQQSSERGSKHDAFKVWRKLPPEVKAIAQAAMIQACAVDWINTEDQYIPHVVKWLRGRRWEVTKMNRPAKRLPL